MRTYALICAYNESKTINDIIGKTLKYVDRIILVDDGSCDNTYKIVMEKYGNNKRVIMLSYPDNRGKGYATIQGFKRFLKEKGNMLVTIDADGQHDPKDIPVVELMVKKKYSDIVIGSRYMKLRGYPKLRIFFNVFSTMVVLLSSGGFFTDVASGFRCYSREAVKYILPRIDLEGFGIELEILQIAKEREMKISTVSVWCSYQCGKKGNFSKLAHGYIKFAMKYKKEILGRIF
ncbi:MAG: glycosyltransferase family 2 protein [Candidatus Aenigmatarchaeota archaeon]